MKLEDEVALVVFDLDGVLVDSEPISCRVTAAALTEVGIQLSEVDVRERFLGTSTTTMLREIEAEYRCRLPACFQESLRERILSAFERQLEPMAGASAMLDRLALARCVASSSHPDRIRRALELTGLFDRLAPHLFSATMVSNGKPAPDLFLLAAAEMEVDPMRCLVVEDSEAGVRAGKAAGMKVLGFTGGSHLRYETHAPRLRAAGADDVVTDMTALVDLVERVVA